MSRPTLLIVDDNERLAQSLQQLLQLHGYNAEICSSGEDALQLVMDIKFDLVLLDLSMPDMNGFDVLTELATYSAPPPVIVISGTKTLNAAIEAMRLGAYDFLRKPYQPEELLHTIENAIEKSRLETQNRSIHARLEESENLYRYLVNSSPDIIYTLDDSGHFTFINHRVETLLGYRRESLIGKHYTEIIYSDDFDRASYAFNERRTGNRATRNIELRLKCKDLESDIRHFEINFITVVLNATGTYGGTHESGTPFSGTYGVARDISDRKKVEEVITRQAYHDTLTGLPNRALFKDRLNVALNHAKRNQQQLAIMFLDLDRFKWVNDTLGHFYGDELLKHVAQRLSGCLRAQDTLARMGGDEFTLLLHDLQQPEDASLVAAKIVDELKRPFLLDEREIFISSSIGIALYPDHGDTIETLIKSADIAMYHVKWRGKNGYQYYEASMNAMFHKKLSMENELRRAIEKKQIMLHYQPQVDVETRKIIGLEALARWHHPELGIISPTEFIPLAEETGLIFSLSEMLLGEACKQMQLWEAAGLLNFRLALNVSPQLVEEESFVSKTLSYIQSHHLKPEFFEIEITENLLVRDLENTVAKLKALGKHGIRIALDDFGTCYSSLSYLRQFPIHNIKIDKSFVGDINTHDESVPIITAISGIAKGFKLDLIAEGVETLQQMKTLHKMGCNIMQGYLFSKPLPAQNITTLLKRQANLFHKNGEPDDALITQH
ncbi:response regulator receiver modulated diguanylate cyclase/phosphodiesterase with PAS/PAC sensor(s) [Methylobacillus flagellatus KT]|uniref:Response regulator receiver modulated diguanylate cyclase/phosphodiesterase with PAS/PAC sensor(S) n=2 Tax=Methylophilaceae TaxID=32011 RepID=Q1H236_METFK|nr:response regulator receiver modulated diguanylate cyclase/phosphodiesterase with PAS/PAC sensor(s) [Methylobacillus flagellatus KT]